MCFHLPPNMLLEAIEFGNQELLFAFNFLANMTFDHAHFPIQPKDNFHPWKLCYLNIQKNLVKFPFLHSFFLLFHGVSVKHITTFCYNILCANINFRWHLGALQTTTPPPPSFEEPTSMTVGKLAKEKNLYLNPFGSCKSTMV